MSTSPSQESVEQTKRQIRSLVNEISELSKSDMVATEYYPAILQRVVSALAAVGGAVWLLDPDGTLRLSYQIQVSENLLDPANDDAVRHVRLLSRVISRGQGELIPPNSVFGEDQSQANPTRYLLVLCPMTSGKKVAGVLEIFQRPDSPPDTQRGYLKFVEHMCKLIGEWLKGQSLQQVSDRQVLWQQSDQFARLVHDNLDLRDTAYTIANEGRRLIECDRVSVATMHGKKAKVIAISGQDSIESRSNIVVSLNRLATRVVRSGEPLWYDGTTEDLPPQLEEAIEEYVDLSHGRTVTILPIHRPERTIEGDVLAKQSVPSESRIKKEIIGALIVEQIETQLSRALLEGRVDLVYEHSCRALANTLSHEQLFLMPLWRFLGRMTWFFRGATLPKTIAVLTLVALGLLALFLVKIDFDLEGNGELQPLNQRRVFAHVDGEVDQVLVEHDMTVQKDQPVVQLRNRDLEVQITNLQGQMKVAIEELSAVQYQKKLGSGISNVDGQQLEAKVRQLTEQVKAQQLELEVLKQKEAKLLRTAPIAGIVTTWEVEKNLRARPVQTGQELLNIADPTGDWQLEVLMPEKRMKYLDQAIAKATEGFLPVEFILMTDSGTTHKGKLFRNQVHQRAEVEGEEGPVVKLRVIPDSMEGISRRPGARVIADIKCGKESAAFTWFHEVVEWIRAHIIF